jgi:tellurite resistance protein TehA-like permease
VAPTFLIGIAPTSIITVILVKFSGAIENVGIGIELSKILPELKIMSLMAWGFSIWWLVLSVILLLHYVKNKNHPFVFGWWAYTFPLGAFAISNGQCCFAVRMDCCIL